MVIAACADWCPGTCPLAGAFRGRRFRAGRGMRHRGDVASSGAGRVWRGGPPSASNTIPSQPPWRGRSRSPRRLGFGVTNCRCATVSSRLCLARCALPCQRGSRACPERGASLPWARRDRRLHLPAYSWMLSAHDRRVHNARRFNRGGGPRPSSPPTASASFAPSYWNTLLFPDASPSTGRNAATPKATFDDYPRWLDAIFLDSARHRARRHRRTASTFPSRFPHDRGGT